MKFSAIFDQIIHKAPPRVERFLSLVLEERYIQVALWHPDERGRPIIEKNQTQRIEEDTWEARTEATDRALTKLDDDETLGNVEKVVLGLSSLYINSTGGVDKPIQGEIKKLCKELDLKPVGFVALHSALIYKLRMDEGVPPTVILLSVSDGTVTVSLYKIGVLAGFATIQTEHLVSELENTFKQWKEVEVLPSRMLLYGTDTTALDEMRHNLLKHPWPTRVAFVHFPKIDILPIGQAVEAVSMAGAAEMNMELGEDESVVAESGVPAKDTPYVPMTTEVEAISTMDDIQPVVANGEEGIEKELRTTLNEDDAYPLVSEEGEQEIAGPGNSSDLANQTPELQEDIAPEHENVVMVAPETLGFRKGEDVLEKVQSSKFKVSSEKIDEETESNGREVKEARELKRTFTMPKFVIPGISFIRIREVFRNAPLPIGVVPIVGAVIMLMLAGFLYVWFVPKATVTLITMPKVLEETLTITVDPSATAADAATNTIPGKTQEKIISGDKTIPVTSKKDKGDPAKGTVTIYNKSLSQKTFKSGTTIVTRGISFSLDNDINVASASESFTQRVYGKTNGTVTALKIGPEGNLPVDTEFTFKDVSSETAVARNDQQFTGGVSREVTVVTRADYDALVKSLTSDLVDKAKLELSSSVGGREKLIDSTIISSVSDKTFQEELDQETNQLHGTITIKVQGTSYGEDDIDLLFGGVVRDKIPQGYNLVAGQTTSKTSDVKVKKDGSISLSVLIKGVAVPAIDNKIIAKAIAGKSIKQAETYLRSVTGVAGMEVSTRWWFLKNMLPPNNNNISISVALQE